MRTSTALLLTITVVAGCSSTPAPPTVDDSTKRPLNHPRLVELQRCVGELAATRATLSEAVHNANIAMATASAEVMASARRAVDGLANTAVPRDKAHKANPNQVFVVRFKLGSAVLQLEQGHADKLIKASGGAQLVVVRGRTDALADSPGESALARRRALAAGEFLALRAGVPKERLRLQWQGAGDTIEPANSAQASATDLRAMNRRVEIEIYAIAPPREVLGNSAM